MSSHTYETSIVVNADASQVWGILSNVEAWPTWTPTMTSVKGLDGPNLEWGATFAVRQPGLMKAEYVVTEFQAGKSFTWYNAVLGVYLLATHVVEEMKEGTCKVALSFEMSGLFAFLVWPLVKKKIRNFVDIEATSLKAASE